MKVKVEIGKVNSIADKIVVYGDTAETTPLVTINKSDFNDDWSTYTGGTYFVDALDVVDLSCIHCRGAEVHTSMYTEADEAMLKEYNHNKIKLNHLDDKEWLLNNIDQVYAPYSTSNLYAPRQVVQVFPSDSNKIISSSNALDIIKSLFNRKLLNSDTPNYANPVSSKDSVFRFGYYPKSSYSSSNSYFYYFPLVSMDLSNIDFSNIEDTPSSEYYYSPSLLNIIRNCLKEKRTDAIPTSSQSINVYPLKDLEISSAFTLYKKQVESSILLQAIYKDYATSEDTSSTLSSIWPIGGDPSSYPITCPWKVPKTLTNMNGFFMGMRPSEIYKNYSLPEGVTSARGLFLSPAVGSSKNNDTLNFFEKSLKLTNVVDASYLANNSGFVLKIAPECIKSTSIKYLRGAFTYCKFVPDQIDENTYEIDIQPLFGNNIKDLAFYGHGSSFVTADLKTIGKDILIKDFTVDLTSKSVDATYMLPYYGKYRFGVINLIGFKGCKHILSSYMSNPSFINASSDEKLHAITTNISPFTNAYSKFSDSLFSEIGKTDKVKDNFEKPGFLLYNSSNTVPSSYARYKIFTDSTISSVKACPLVLLANMSILDEQDKALYYIDSISISSSSTTYSTYSQTQDSSGRVGTTSYNFTSSTSSPLTIENLIDIPYMQSSLGRTPSKPDFFNISTSSSSGPYWVDGIIERASVDDTNNAHDVIRSGKSKKIFYDLRDFYYNYYDRETTIKSIIKPVYNIKLHKDVLLDNVPVEINISKILRSNPSYPYDFKIKSISAYRSAVLDRKNTQYTYIRDLIFNQSLQYWSSSNHSLSITDHDLYNSGIDISKTNFAINDDGELIYKVWCTDIFDDSISVFTDFGYIDYVAEIDGYEFHGRTSLSLRFFIDFTILEDIEMNSELYADDETTDLIPNIIPDEDDLESEETSE